MMDDPQLDLVPENYRMNDLYEDLVRAKIEELRASIKLLETANPADTIWGSQRLDRERTVAKIQLSIEVLDSIVRQATTIRSMLAPERMPGSECLKCVGRGRYQPDDGNGDSLPCEVCHGTGIHTII